MLHHHGPGNLALVALIVYLAVMVSLAMLKAFYRIGYLWDPAAHRNRSVELVPFNEVMSNSNWFIPVFGYGGNIAFFVPFGMLAYVWFHQLRGVGTRMVLWSTLTGFLVSLAIEVSQFLFSLGYSDIDDLLMNTLGAFVGTLCAQGVGSKIFPSVGLASDLIGSRFCSIGWLRRTFRRPGQDCEKHIGLEVCGKGHVLPIP